MKKIGVLGGMGPEATVRFYSHLINECQVQFNAQKDEDYPEIFIYNLPIPDVVNDISNQKKTVFMLQNGAQLLEKTGSDFIAIPCNTVHYFYDAMRHAVKVPILNSIDETAKQLRINSISCVGILATSTTIQTELYQKTLQQIQIQCVLPEKQEEVTTIIENILAGKKIEEDKNKLKRIIQSMQKQGAQAVVLGCTDLPLLLTQKDVSIPLFDSLEILAKATIGYCCSKKRVKMCLCPTFA